MLLVRLAWRNLWRNTRRTLITVSSIAFAVLLAQWLGAMTRGSHEQMIDNMTRFHTGYVQVQQAEYEAEPSLDNTLTWSESFRTTLLSAHARAGYVVPRLESFMLASGGERTRGAQVLGVDLAAESRLNELDERLTAGRFFAPDEAGVVVAAGLAERLALEVGDELVLLGQGRFGFSAAGRYPVVGLMKHPLQSMNSQTVYLPLTEAQWLLSAEDQVSSVLVMPPAVHHVDAVAAALADALSGRSGYDAVRVATWQDLMPDLLAALRFDAASQYLMVGVLYLVIAFGFFGTVMMVTLERRREFSVLIAIGMQRTRLGVVLFLETVLLSLLGALGGSLVGIPLVAWFVRHPIPLGGDMAEMVGEMDMGIEPLLEFSAAPDIFWQQGLVVFVLAVLIGLYPVLKALHLNVARGNT